MNAGTERQYITLVITRQLWWVQIVETAAQKTLLHITVSLICVGFFSVSNGLFAAISEMEETIYVCY